MFILSEVVSQGHEALVKKLVQDWADLNLRDPVNKFDVFPVLIFPKVSVCIIFSGWTELFT